MGKYLDIARKFEARQRTEAQQVVSPSPGPKLETVKPTCWTCANCGQPLSIDDVYPSLDGERTLTLWRCDPCGVAGVTPDAIQRPPAVWVKTVQQ